MLRFDEEFDKLTRDDQEYFAKVVNNLLLHTYIVREVFSPREKMMHTNPDYRFLERHFELVEEYLGFSGWILEKDAINGVVALINKHQQNRVRLDRETSLVLFFLRLVYDKEKGESTGSSGESVYLTTTQLVLSMKEHGVFLPGKKLTNRGVCRNLRTLNNRNIISRISGRFDDGDVSFYILPSILHAIDNDKIVAMSEAIEKLQLENIDSANNLGGDE